MNFFEKTLMFFYKIPSVLWSIVKLALDGFFTVFNSFFFMIFDGFLFTVTTLISALDLSSLAFTEIASWADLPPQLIYLINQLGLPQCAGILAGAITIRMILNIIPAAVTRI
ncbi:MAG: DUF2523 domain-containing protein [Proteobacteria bacterium]|nr:DUF2523 domain-containing protein [Pseudomonadota bacterium]MBU1686303.1 DUF2523 domain-containing protein [Pseudomonadota bacterium]